ncbi:MAG: cobalt ECF transporter T component CbiQ, partial [Planctomycetes bacterium]|nr:cobalt ECF transporter T component CbiQ [Planctomycetota bacterium]
TLKKSETISMSLNVEHLSPRDSLFARFDPRWKLAALLLSVVAVAVMRSPIILLAALVGSLTLAAIARLPGRWFRARIGLLLFALVPFLIILPLTVDRGGITYHLLGLRFSEVGFLAAGALLCRSIAIVTLMLILLGTAPLHHTLRAAQRLGCPGFLVMLTMLSYRYIFLLFDEFERIRIALRVRGFRNRTNAHSYRTIGQVTGTLLLRGLERAERVNHAMRCRGFDGHFRSLDEFRTRKWDVLMFLLIVGFFGVLFGVDFVVF